MPVTRTAVTLALFAVVVLTSPAAAFDLTGTWTGTRTCKDLSAGAKLKFKEPATLSISQSGNAIGIVVDITGVGTTSYTALANFPAAKPDKGEFAMIHCGTNDVAGDATTFDAIGRMQATTKTGKVKAKIKGVSFFSDTDTVTPTLGTCNWSLTRTDVTDPVVALTCNGGGASRRAVKTEIDYLSDTEIRSLHDELLAFRLASWRYTTPGATPARHLGFIIDDVEPSPSIAENGNTVDVYGYASMAVAAVQTQAREIAELQAQVAALQKERAPARARRK